MKEQSHKEEMSAAIRGDFRRLRERGVAATLAPRDGPPIPAGDAPGEPTAEPHVDTAATEPLGHEAVPEGPVDEPEPEPGAPLEATEDADRELPSPAERGPEAVPRPGFLARLMGR